MRDAVVIDLLRHGETGTLGFRGRLDDALTPVGWAQMRLATQATQPWDAVVSSPLMRCASFAHAFAMQHNLPCRLDTRLTEIDFGDWEGWTAEKLMQTQGAELSRFWQNPWEYAPPNGERMTDFEARVRLVWHDLQQRHDGQRVLVVTHGGVIRLLLCLHRRLSRNDLLQLEVPHASLHRIGGPDPAAL